MPYNGFVSVTAFHGTGLTLRAEAAWSHQPFEVDQTGVFPPEGSCRTSVWSPPYYPPGVSAPAAPFLDPGPLSLQVLGTSFSLTQAYPNVFTAQTRSTQAYAPRAVYSLVGSGGVDIPAFREAFSAPSDLILTSPAASSSGLLVTAANGLPITWTSTGGVDDVVVTFFWPSPLQTCTFRDSGSATIPPSVLEAYRGMALDIQIGKMSVGSFTTPTVGATFVSVDVSTILPIDVR